LIPLIIKKACEKRLAEKFARQVTIQNFSFVGGGCINEAGRLSTNIGDYFIKWNDARSYPKMFEAEAKGLELLHAANTMPVPEVIMQGEAEQYSFLVLAFISAVPRKPDYWKDFGVSLAQLHQHTHPQFGLDSNNYIGSLPQDNTFHDDWLSFFIEERLSKQLTIAKKNKAIPSAIYAQFENLYKKLPEIFPDEKPALLHGDLWSGNFMTGNDGSAWLIDPAVYYGNREAELAFTKLFGGFDSQFYEAYNHHFPLFSDFEDRVDIYNLYPLMVHVNLFGGGYLSSVESILKYRC